MWTVGKLAWGNFIAHNNQFDGIYQHLMSFVIYPKHITPINANSSRIFLFHNWDDVKTQIFSNKDRYLGDCWNPCWYSNNYQGVPNSKKWPL